MIHIDAKGRVETLTNEITEEQQAAIRTLGSDLDRDDILVPKVVKRQRYIVAFDHHDPGSEIEHHLENARNLRSAYYNELMRRIWGHAARWLGKHVPRKTPPEITVGHRHRAGS